MKQIIKFEARDEYGWEVAPRPYPATQAVPDWCCDHCHTKDKARGLLCVQCNAGLGYFKDNLEFLQSAIDYLKKWQ